MRVLFRLLLLLACSVLPDAHSLSQVAPARTPLPLGEAGLNRQPAAAALPGETAPSGFVSPVPVPGSGAASAAAPAATATPVSNVLSDRRDPRTGKPLVTDRAETAPPVAEWSGPQSADLPEEFHLPTHQATGAVLTFSEESKSNFAALERELAAMADEFDWGGGRFAGYVEDARYSLPLFNRNGSALMIPGSPQRLVTLAAAIDTLGLDWAFETELRFAGDLQSRGRWKGNLIVVGSGDPTICSRIDAPSRDGLSTFREWAKRLRDMGARSIDGHVVGSAEAFDEQWIGPAWPEGNWAIDVCAEVSALTCSDNRIEFRWLPERKGKARYTLSPLFEYVQTLNSVRVDAAAGENWRRYERGPEGNLFDVRGFVPPKMEVSDFVPIHDPPAFFLKGLHAALHSEGVSVKGASMPLALAAAPDVATSGSQLLFTHRSPALRELADSIVKRDRMLAADLLFKALGREVGMGGSFDGGRRAVEAYLARAGLSGAGFIAMDGSGLSRLNRMAPEQLVALMKRVAQQEYGEAFFRCFPRGGGAELPGHFQWSPASQSLGTRVCAVDGFLPGTHSLAGWTVTAGGRKVYFAFMVNGAALPKSQAREWLDRMALAIAQSPLRENL